MASEFLWGPSAILLLEINSKYRVILANPTSICDEMSGADDAPSTSLSPALLPFLLTSRLFLFLKRLPFEAFIHVAR